MPRSLLGKALIISLLGPSGLSLWTVRTFVGHQYMQNKSKVRSHLFTIGEDQRIFSRRLSNERHRSWQKFSDWIGWWYRGEKWKARKSVDDEQRLLLKNNWVNKFLSFYFLLDASISPRPPPPPDYEKQSKQGRSYSLRSTSSSSITSLGSNGANVRISLAPLSSDSEASTQMVAIEAQLKRAALVEAAGMRKKKIKLFLSKYCGIHSG